jgi:hypothetical protein
VTAQRASRKRQCDSLYFATVAQNRQEHSDVVELLCSLTLDRPQSNAGFRFPGEACYEAIEFEID